MEGYISKKAALESVSGLGISIAGLRAGKTILSGFAVLYRNAILQAIEAIPAADVRPVVRGEWRKSELFNDHPECSVCSYVSGERSNFCPNCGAVMDGGSNG